MEMVDKQRRSLETETFIRRDEERWNLAKLKMDYGNN